jgi:hypothetical protein
VIPTNGYDQLWLMVKRTINSQTVITVEYLTDPFIPQATSTPPAVTDYSNAFFVDCGQQYNGSPTTTLTGLSYLNGSNVTVLGDGIVYPNLPVSGGSVTVPVAVSKASVGIPYTATLTTLHVPQAEVQGKMVYPEKAYMFLLGTEGGTAVGPNGSVLITDASSGNTGALPFSGYTKVNVNQGYARTQTLTFQQTQPLPFQILNLQLDYGASPK